MSLDDLFTEEQVNENFEAADAVVSELEKLYDGAFWPHFPVKNKMFTIRWGNHSVTKAQVEEVRNKVLRERGWEI